MNMNEFIKKIQKLKDGVILQSRRKEEIRANLESFMRGQGAVRETELARHIGQRSWQNIFAPKTMIAGFLALMLVLGGGTSFAAEAAVPGDVLYPVKVGMNEEIRAAFAFSAEAKAEWEAERAERRLVEAERLAAEGRLDAAAKAELEARFAAHAEKAKERIEAMQDDKTIQFAAGLLNRFEASLDAHNRLLSRIEAQVTDPERQERINEIQAKVDARLDAVRNLRAEVEARVEARLEAAGVSAAGSATSSAQVSSPEIQTAAEGKINAAENVIAATRRYLDRRSAEVSASARAEAEAKLAAANELVADARAKVSAGAYAEAFRLANKAIRTAEEARVALRAETDLRIRIGDDEDEDTDGEDGVTNFDACLQLNGVVLQTYPERCVVRGRVFVNPNQPIGNGPVGITASGTVEGGVIYPSTSTEPAPGNSNNIRLRFFNLFGQ